MSFHVASSAAEDWAHAAQAVVDGLGKLPPETNLGFLYLSDLLAADARNVLNYVRERTGVRHWIGTVGMGVVAGADELFDRPALAVMAADMPEDTFRIFTSISDSPSQLNGDIRAWARGAAPIFGVVHGDPNNPKVPALIGELGEDLSCFLVGGLTSSRADSYQFADVLTGGGVSGILFSPAAGAVATGLTQGCVPIGKTHIVSEGIDNVLMEIDGQRALDVFMTEVGARYGPNLNEVAGQLHVALPIEGTDTGDYTVRNILGIDATRGWIGVGCVVKPGDRVMFVCRDADSARADLKTMVEKVRSRADRAPRGALYVSCIARGPNMFSGAQSEAQLLRQALGDVPLVGIYANGEISNNRLYGYTGVLTLFL